MSYAQGPGWKLYRGNCLTILNGFPDASFDAVITDPPYSSGGTHAPARMASTTNKYVQSGCEASSIARGKIEFLGDNRDQRSWTFWCTLWLSECLRLVRPGGYCLFFIDWRQLPAATDAFQAAGWMWRGLIAWNKGLGARAPNIAYFRHQCEYLVWGTNGSIDKSRSGRGPWPGCLTFPVLQSDKFHQTGKPTELLRQLVKVVPAGSRILDPFAGSATTLRAAVLEGREAVGIELSPHYSSIACERLRACPSLCPSGSSTNVKPKRRKHLGKQTP